MREEMEAEGVEIQILFCPLLQFQVVDENQRKFQKLYDRKGLPRD